MSETAAASEALRARRLRMPDGATYSTSPEPYCSTLRQAMRAGITQCLRVLTSSADPGRSFQSWVAVFDRIASLS
jgi:hypothetical protein